MVSAPRDTAAVKSPAMAGGFPRSCSWSVTPATPPVAALSPPDNPLPLNDGAHRSRCYDDHLRKRASLSMVVGGLWSPTRPNHHNPRPDRAARRSLGAVWRVSSSSPARQLGAWLGRRPRSFAGTEDNVSAMFSSGHTLAPPTSPVPSLCSSSPEPPSPLESSGARKVSGGSIGTALCLSSSPSAASLSTLNKTAAPRRPTRLVISGRARPRRLYHTPCVSRLCNVTVTRLQVTQPLGGDLNSVTLAVKMQSSKRTLRSNEIPLPPSGTLDIELQLTFSLQYPHFLKREGNTLQIMLQRRKKYKNRTFLGFKTLAVGVVNMSQVLQRPVDRELELYSEGKEKGTSLARVTMVSLSSQPVDTDEPTERTKSFMADNPALASLLVLLSRGLSQGLPQGGSSPLLCPDNPIVCLPSLTRIPGLTDRSVDLVEVYSDDDEDYSSQDEGSDSEPILEDGSRRTHHHLRSSTRSKSLPPNARQRNLKQRFIALLKRFKVPEALQAFDQDQELDPRTGGEVDEAEIEDLFDELEDLSDSGPEVDTISITSTPKPSLRPYFSSSRSLLNEGGTYLRLKVPADKVGADRLSDESSKRADSDHMENWTDQEHSDPQCLASSPPREDKNKSNKNKLFNRDRSNMSLKERKSITSTGGSTPRQEKMVVERSNSSANVDSSPRKVLLEQLARVLPLEDVQLPDHVVLVNTGDSHGALLAAHLTEHGHRVITTMALADVKATVSHLVNKLQKFCNSNLKAPGPMKVVVVGSDLYISCVLRPYVDQFSSKPPDFQNHVRFLIIPLGVNSLAKYLGSIDSVYGEAFVSESWREVVERWEKPDVQEVVNRVHHYLTQAQQTLHLPIAEAMLTYKEKSGDDESSQAFVPFIMDVRLGSGDVTSSSVDLDDPITAPAAVILPGSPPAASTPTTGLNIDKTRDNTTPPSSPNINSSHLANYKLISEGIGQEPLDLQVDYWLVRGSGREEKEKDKEKDKARVEGGKYTLKTSFRTLQVARLAPLGVTHPFDPSTCHHLTLSFATKEKKQRIMRLGKKKERERETESRREVVDGVSRLLGSAKNQPFKVSVDSAEWTNVKFFQLSSQWQTQIKYFPISLFSLQDSNL
ncbi:phosphofurin acidic cluster sorting protein 2 isoform X2 [Cherax quadricarinatus]|uniref:phosphofurin acidic cluster sorting protein 2 isoform X2 n=1 Tax=Cherax quadricarinatus TaxID=27406 RepID=UPI00237846CF|nr:phosphofurin acidic cluster sorting protein 2-like isoform X2 [Cherax quadricarinatus]